MTNAILTLIYKIKINIVPFFIKVVKTLDLSFTASIKAKI